MKTALIVGISGIVGGNLSDLLVSTGEWSVYGVARRPGVRTGVTTIAADLRDKQGVAEALQTIKPTHVFLAAWLRQATEAQNILVNGGMTRDILSVVSRPGTVRHVALVTGLKHYLGPFEAYGKGTLPATPFREDQPRLEVENFYYAQEDELFHAAERDGFRWTVHRPHTIIGKALGNAMNMGVTLAVYASICKELGSPIRFPGSPVQWSGLTDMTDARVLAKHLLWATETAGAWNQTFNVVNGDVFRWQWMWERIGDWFGVKADPPEGGGTPLEQQLAQAAPVWKQMASKYQLVEDDLNVLASAWHTDADLGRPIEVLTDMSKSRKLGFTAYQATDESFFDLFQLLRTERVIP